MVSSSEAAGTIAENFADNQYNKGFWEFWNQGAGTTAQVTNERLEGIVSGSGYAGFGSRGFTLIGDFDMRADFTLLNWPPSPIAGGTQISLGTFNVSPTELFQVARANGFTQEFYFTYILSNYTSTTPVPVLPLSGTLRMVRTGNKMEGFYLDSDGTTWRSIGSTTDPQLGTQVGVSLQFGPFGGTYSGTPATAAFDNIQITYATLGPGFYGNPCGAIVGMLLD
jgi:hypothetical protein